MTVMFTHKAIGAWDALASGLIEAGFVISATWPVNTEFDNALGIREKAAAKSTVFLACRPRIESSEEARYWEDVEPKVAEAVRKRVKEFQDAGIGGVDLYLACFGPALEVFSSNWPLRRGQPRPTIQKVKGRRKQSSGEGEHDPYAVTAEDALDAARREVKRWRLEQLMRMQRQTELDPVTEWFVLAWDAYKAPEFPYDEALRLARVVGVDIENDIIRCVAQKKAGNILLWDSATRVAKSALGPPDGSRAILDSLHHAAHLARTKTLDAARELMEKSGATEHPSFYNALEAVLEVLPVSTTFTKVEETGIVAEAANDFDALEHLRRLAYAEKVDEPTQLKLWEDA